MNFEITSLKNPRIKHLMALQKPRDRREHGEFVVEGVREVSLCAQSASFKPREIYLCPEIYQADPNYPIDTSRAVHLPAEVFNKVAYRENVGGIVAVCPMAETRLGDLPNESNPLYLILEKVEKPGNIGAMLRTADAAGVSAVIVCDPATDFFNPNVVRSSLGCLFTVPVASGSSEEVQSWLQERGVRSFAAALSDQSVSYHIQDYTGATAFLLGSEADGLSDFWMKRADGQVIIPMRGKIDSMNVSNAAAILIYEAMRQRGFG